MDSYEVIQQELTTDSDTDTALVIDPASDSAGISAALFTEPQKYCPTRHFKMQLRNMKRQTRPVTT